MELIHLRRFINPCRTPEETAKFRTALIKALIFLAVLAALTILFYNQISAFFHEPEVFRDWVTERGTWGKVVFTALMSAQIVVPFLPGEPMEVAAGAAFGTFGGLVLCLIGALIGGFLVFTLVKRMGKKSLETLFSQEALKSASFLRDEKSFTTLFFVLFLIPGTPKDILTYMAGFTKMRLGTYLMISTFARIPSIITSTIAGSALLQKQYAAAAVVYGVTAILALGGLLYYKKLSKANCPESGSMVK